MKERSLGFRNWTEEEVRRLRELVAARTPTNVIARRLNRTEGAIRFKARAEGIALAKWLRE